MGNINIESIKKELKAIKKPLKPKFLKGLFDRGFAAVVLVITSPLILFILVLMGLEFIFNKESRGPFFYRETRISLGKEFRIYKFRTIKVSGLEKYGWIAKNAEKAGGHFTFVGKLLHKFYVDELPQFFNVILGDLSVVGPRPWDKDTHNKSAKNGENNKLLVKPGITGPVAITKGTEAFMKDLNYENSNDLDYNYIYNYLHLTDAQFFLYDLRVMARTVKIILEAKGL